MVLPAGGAGADGAGGVIEPIIIGNATLYCGDCREILPNLPKADAVITDPPWDAAHGIPGSEDPRGLFADVAPLLQANRFVIQLGCDSDPAFLLPLACLHPYLRTCWLEYARPTYKGRLLHTGDVAYVYGEWPIARLGATVIPGRCISTHYDHEFKRGPRRKGKGGHEALEHPMPRRLEHVAWLTKWFARGLVIDPFMGSGTTGICAIQQGHKFIGIEISNKFFDLAYRRIEDAQRQQRMFA